MLTELKNIYTDTKEFKDMFVSPEVFELLEGKLIENNVLPYKEINNCRVYIDDALDMFETIVMRGGG